jgi:flagellin
MGLRINTNSSSLDALRNLHLSDRAQQRSLERLSSGLRINRGADDPSGLVIAERLRSQISALKQDSQNSQNAANLISTADASLQKINDLLTEVQDSIQFALSSGSSSPDQIAAEQDSVDQAIAAIDRIAQTTRFGDRELLNGNSGYKLGASVPLSGGVPMFTNMVFRSVSFQGSTDRSLIISPVANPLRAQTAAAITGNNALTSTTLRVTGSRGTVDVTVAAAANAATVGAAINAVAEQTGVLFNSGDSRLYSESFGSSELVTIEVTAGGLTGGGLTAPGNVVSARGADGIVSLNGQQFTGKGLHFSISNPDASFEFDMNSDLYPLTPPALVLPGTVVIENGTGLSFQLREQSSVTDRLGMGIDGATAATLGFEQRLDIVATTVAATNSFEGGFLSAVKTGGGSDLTQNAANAMRIVNTAAAQVAKSRGFLGAVVGFSVEPNIDSIDVAVQNLSSSLSTLRDLDFAEETANFTRVQILFQSGIAALASARTIPQSVLTLLGGR